MFRWAIAAALLASSGAALAADAPGEEADRRICRSTAVTGSRVTKNRECHTQSEWREIDAARAQEAKKLVDDVIQSSGAATAGAVGSPRS